MPMMFLRQLSSELNWIEMSASDFIYSAIYMYSSCLYPDLSVAGYVQYTCTALRYKLAFIVTR